MLDNYNKFLLESSYKKIKETERTSFVYKDHGRDKYYLAPFYKKFIEEKYGKIISVEIIETKIVINGQKLDPKKFIKENQNYIRYYICSVEKETVKVENNIVTYTANTKTKELAHTKATFKPIYILNNDFSILDIAVKTKFITDLEIINISKSDNQIVDYKQLGNLVFFYTIIDNEEKIYKTYEIMEDGTLNEKAF
jgi:hypothetical protein